MRDFCRWPLFVVVLACACVSTAAQPAMSLISAGWGTAFTQDTPVATSVDIKPGSCPNPLNVRENGRLPVALVGGQDFDVRQVDVASILLEGVAPIDAAFEDVTAPVTDSGPCACTTRGPDGWLDLTLKFSIGDVVEAIGLCRDGEVISLTLTGSFLYEYGGTPFSASDCIVIRSKGPQTK